MACEDKLKIMSVCQPFYFYVYPTDDELTDGNREKVASSVFLFYFLFLITFTSTLTLRIHKMWSIKW